MIYEYNCIIDHVVDGDTIDVHIDLGFDNWVKHQRIRLHDIDTPETRTSDKIEEHFGELAEQFVKKMLPEGSIQRLKSKAYNPKGSYGRILADFEFYDAPNDRWTSLCQTLVDVGYAAKYRTGQDQILMEQEHLNNRRKLIDAGISTMTYEEAGVEEA